jgi:hypothetical protein
MFVASKWISREKCYMANTISAAALRGVWLTRNDFDFKWQDWTDVKQLLRRVLALAMEWKPLCKPSKIEEMKNWCSFLETRIREPLQITST